jgi:hypothetical protein
VLRISTTTIESYRLFMQPEQDWMSESDLLATIRGEFHPTPAINLGLAWGKVLEDPYRYQVPGGFACNGFTFDRDDLQDAFDVIDYRGVFEAKAEKRYDDCNVVSKADHLLGAHLSEFKTTGSTFDFDKYARSCQWRFMADAFDPSRITYHVFLLDDHGNGVASLKGIESFDLYPYPALHEDCAALVRSFAAYVTAKGLDGMLRERQAKAEAA